MGKESSRGKTIITSYGGVAGTVTGSCHVLEARGFKMAVDLGIFQGKKDDKIVNGINRNDSYATEILRGTEHIVLTHGHMDHACRAPWAFAKGFRPRIYATKETIDFSKPLWEDSIKVQESKFRDSKSKDKNNRLELLYDKHNVETMLRHTIGFDTFKEIPIGNNITIEFITNGHVEGSSSILVRNYNNKKNILFTGDVGKPIQSLCGGYMDFAYKYPQDPIHAIVIESTNFEKEPVSAEESKEKMLDIINETFEDGGNVLFPLISFHRNSEMKENFHNYQNNGKISSRTKFVEDGPLPKIMENVYIPEYLTPRFGNDPFFYKTVEESMSRFNLQNSIVVGSHKESIAKDLELAHGGNETVILASGGMGDHGRSVNYLKGYFCKNPKNAVIYTCHQVEGTYGANMVYREKNSKDKHFGAKVYQLGGFTGHASGFEYTDYMEKFNLSELEIVEIVHGGLSSAEKMAGVIEKRYSGVKTVIPSIRQSIEFF